MLKTYITDFAAYCKVTDFSDKSKQSLNASLQDFSIFINEQGRGLSNITNLSVLKPTVHDKSTCNVECIGSKIIFDVSCPLK